MTDPKEKSPAEKLNKLVVQSVDGIADRAAKEVEDIRDSLAAEHLKIHDWLTRYAAAIRDNGVLATQMIGDFCRLSDNTVSGIQAVRNQQPLKPSRFLTPEVIERRTNPEAQPDLLPSTTEWPPNEQ
jgi:hypothetical protein